MISIRSLPCVVVTLALCAGRAPLFAQVVTLSLSSPQNGATVTAGQVIQWSIEFTVSAGDNEGLALLVVDLVQSTSNPALFDIPPAAAVPPGMSYFARPAGITNPGDSDPLTGYLGVQRGPDGAKNLLQVGGAQNTFGVARPPGSGAAESAVVEEGIGQSGSTLLACGSFAAPAACGTYSFSLTNAIVNVLSSVNPPPGLSTVAPATVVVDAESVIFSIIPEADLNADCEIDLVDASLLVDVLLGNPTSPEVMQRADVDHDGSVDGRDVQAFVNRFLGD